MGHNRIHKQRFVPKHCSAGSRLGRPLLREDGGSDIKYSEFGAFHPHATTTPGSRAGQTSVGLAGQARVVCTSAHFFACDHVRAAVRACVRQLSFDGLVSLPRVGLERVVRLLTLIAAVIFVCECFRACRSKRAPALGGPHIL